MAVVASGSNEKGKGWECAKDMRKGTCAKDLPGKGRANERGGIDADVIDADVIRLVDRDRHKIGFHVVIDDVLPARPVPARPLKIRNHDEVAFLRAEYPAAFGKARMRSYGMLGVRQTRWIVGRQQLTVDDVRAGRSFPDAVARTGWPIELHDTPQGHVWEPFPDDHLHYVPFGSLVSPECDNMVAAGRNIDGDVAALSSVRVMGPCIAMGAAAAHALDLAGAGSVHQIDAAALRERVKDNVERVD